MILDTLTNSAAYEGLASGFTEAFKFLNQPGLAELEDGTYEIAGDRVFAIAAHDSGRDISAGKLEGHRKHIDIQYIISGDESMGWAPLEHVTSESGYDPEKDLEFFEGDPEAVFCVPPGSFTVFLPTDAHLPLIGSGPIHKVVVKIAIG